MHMNWNGWACAALLVLGVAAGCQSERALTPEIDSVNDSLRAFAGAGAPALCGSRGLPRCAAGKFCKFSEAASCGDTDRPGVCTDIPRVCPQIFMPVCGCNGRTFANACSAAALGVSVRSQGPCEVKQRSCGGLLGLQCQQGEYCDFAPEAMCGRADQTGTCKPRPAACTKEFRPVCGCDGQTYGNACTAAAAGVSVESLGACPGEGEGEVCGGLLGIGCSEGQYCDFAAGDGCDVADGQGVCTVQPELCPQVFDPVCGCDGVTYGNACEAARSGASVRAPGKCGKY